jgi:predicted nucleotidyltransferase
VKPEKVAAVVQRLIDVARPKEIILFGSYVRGELTRVAFGDLCGFVYLPF